MPVRPKIENFPKIRGAMKLYRVTSIITGTFLLLLVVMMVFRYGFQVDIEFTTAYGFGLNDRALITESGAFNVSIAILTAHGWFYVLYLFSDFRMWSLMRWNFGRFIIVALGGVIPFLSFIVERHYHHLAVAELAAIEAEARPVEVDH